MKYVLRALVAAGLASALVGCGNSEYSQVDIPEKPGNYFQVFVEGGRYFAEIAVVNEDGSKESVVGEVDGKPDLGKTLNKLRVMFGNCGLLTFTQPQLASTQVFSSHDAYGACDVKPIPAVWQRIGSTHRG